MDVMLLERRPTGYYSLIALCALKSYPVMTDDVSIPLMTNDSLQYENLRIIQVGKGPFELT